MEALSPEDLLRFETLTDEECKKELQKLITSNLQSAIANKIINHNSQKKKEIFDNNFRRMSYDDRL